MLAESTDVSVEEISPNAVTAPPLFGSLPLFSPSEPKTRKGPRRCTSSLVTHWRLMTAKNWSVWVQSLRRGGGMGEEGGIGLIRKMKCQFTRLLIRGGWGWLRRLFPSRLPLLPNYSPFPFQLLSPLLLLPLDGGGGGRYPHVSLHLHHWQSRHALELVDDQSSIESFRQGLVMSHQGKIEDWYPFFFCSAINNIFYISMVVLQENDTENNELQTILPVCFSDGASGWKRCLKWYWIKHIGGKLTYCLYSSMFKSDLGME